LQFPSETCSGEVLLAGIIEVVFARHEKASHFVSLTDERNDYQSEQAHNPRSSVAQLSACNSRMSMRTPTPKRALQNPEGIQADENHAEPIVL